MAIVEKRYAQALLNCSKSQNDNEAFEQGLNSMASLFSSNMQFKKILLDPRIGNDVKLNIIKEIFPEHQNAVFLSFLNLLLDKNRINIIDGISDEYSKLNSVLNNELNMKIVSAKELNEEEINSLTLKYKGMYNADKVKYTLEIDKEILGGIKVVIGNKIYDGSLKTQLRRML
ncbi:MAG: ATP synthase F1 subunit delta [Clostridiales bacterium]|nr:ATP synthase F1 subunit delta [Clostridiales bacterium]